MRQNNRKAALSRFPDPARARHGIENRHAGCHFFQKFRCNLFVYLDLVFFFVAVSGTHDTVYDRTVVRHQKETLGIFIESSHRVNPHRVGQIIDDVVFLPFFRSTDDAARFVEGEIDFFLLRDNGFAFHDNNVARLHLHAGFRAFSVYRNLARFCQTVRLPPRADARIT